MSIIFHDPPGESDLEEYLDCLTIKYGIHIQSSCWLTFCVGGSQHMEAEVISRKTLSLSGVVLSNPSDGESSWIQKFGQNRSDPTKIQLHFKY